MRDLAALRRDRRTVFGLSASQIYRRLKAAAVHAGLGDGYGAHSARIGMAKRMASAKAPLAVVMRQGRWSTPRMVARMRAATSRPPR